MAPEYVAAASFAAPVARFTQPCDPLTRRCTFYGGTSSDDIKVTGFSWSLGDGVSYSSPTHPNVTHTYPRVGEYRVMLVVSDADGNKDSAVKLVWVGPPDAPPVARFSASCAGLKCTFWGKYSTDDRGIVRYSWDLGDGVSYSDSVHPNVTHSYRTASTITVRLVVTDASLQTDTLLKQVTIGGPAALVNVNFDDGTLGSFGTWAAAGRNIDVVADPTNAGRGKVARL